MNRKTSLICLFILGTYLLSTQQAIASDNQLLVTKNDVKYEMEIFAKEMADKHQFDEKSVFKLLSNLQHRQDIIEKISKPAESMPWYKYRKIWMKPTRINQGVKFWNKHQKTLAAAEEKYGVDQAIIVAIIGVETLYGKHQGTYPVLEALHTLAFYYPKRATFFRSELAEYFILARKQGWNLSETKGSYAGAMGMGQFISSSYRQYAVDFNNDGKTNLFSDHEDLIGSVAHYFKRHHWRKNGFVIEPVELTEKQLSLVQDDLKPKRTLAEMQHAQIDVVNLQHKSETAAIYAFDKSDKEKEYWLAAENFYVITRYNHNAMYALAVYQLSEAIKSQKAKNKTKLK